jgi:hypothetical protein
MNRRIVKSNVPRFAIKIMGDNMETIPADALLDPDGNVLFDPDGNILFMGE